MPDGEPQPLLEVVGLNVFYGPIQAVFDAAFSVPAGTIVTLLGANGAGKTTTLRAVSGFISPKSGQVRLDGRVLGKLSPERRVSRGMTMVADNRLLFPSLTVSENLRAGGFLQHRGDIARHMETVFQYFPVLFEFRKRHASALSGGQAQMLAIGRALMTAPKLLMLDEPSQGLAPKVVVELFALIRRLSEEIGMTVLLVEQNATLALDVASYGYVLSNGAVALQGPTAHLRSEDSIRRLYLGG